MLLTSFFPYFSPATSPSYYSIASFRSSSSSFQPSEWKHPSQSCPWVATSVSHRSHLCPQSLRSHWDGSSSASLLLLLIVQSLSCVQLFGTPWTAAACLSSLTLSLWACSNSCPLSRWCHPTISSSVTPSPPAFNLSQHQCLFLKTLLCSILTCIF